jgi:hypothetical protein
MLIEVDWNRSYIMITFQVILDGLASIGMTLEIASPSYRLR